MPYTIKATPIIKRRTNSQRQPLGIISPLPYIGFVFIVLKIRRGIRLGDFKL